MRGIPHIIYVFITVLICPSSYSYDSPTPYTNLQEIPATCDPVVFHPFGSAGVPPAYNYALQEIPVTCDLSPATFSHSYDAFKLEHHSQYNLNSNAKSLSYDLYLLNWICLHLRRTFNTTMSKEAKLS